MIYGNAPKDLGIFELNPSEMMYFLYFPLKMPGTSKYYDTRLNFLIPMMSKIDADFINSFGRDAYLDSYIYITIKTMFVQPGAPGNREGWHADGFGSGGDINYIWADMNPTEFAIQEFTDIPDDDKESMIRVGEQFNGTVVTYPNKSILRLDESVIHRVAENMVLPGIRTFVKVSYSKHKFNNQYNSHNYAFDYNWNMVERTIERNLDAYLEVTK